MCKHASGTADSEDTELDEPEYLTAMVGRACTRCGIEVEGSIAIAHLLIHLQEMYAALL